MSAASAPTADPAGDLYKEAKESLAKLHAMPKEKRFRHHFQEAIDDFHKVEDKYPKSYVADDALYMMGQVYTELYEISRLRGDLDKAIAAYKGCAVRFPKSNYADDCLVLQAKALLRIGKSDPAVVALKSVITSHAGGDMVREAEGLLAREGIRVVAQPTPKATPAAVQAVERKQQRSGGEAQAESQQVSQIKVFTNDGYTQVGIYGGGSMAWTVNELPAIEGKDRRIYVDLKKARIGEDLKKTTTLVDGMWNVKIEDGLLRGARVAQNDPETVRVVLDVVSIEDFVVIPLDDPFRILVKVTGKNAQPPVAVPTALVAATPVPTNALFPAPGATPGLAISLPGAVPATTPDPIAIGKALGDSVEKTGIPLFEQLGGFKVRKIYVDAGHGGNDPGAHGPGGLQEKVVTLAIAKKVKADLIALGYDAHLTREDDSYIALEDRSGKANEGKGNLLVSIHCNSTDTNKNISAVETYYADSASDRAAAKLAATENQTTLQNMSGLAGVVQGLMRSENTDLSARAGQRIQRALFEESRKASSETKDHGLKSALFVVLFTAEMPAVLVETAFISNKKDEKRLKDDKHLANLAKSIARGVDDFAKSVAPAPVQIAVEPKELKEPKQAREESDGESDSPAPKSKTKSGKSKSDAGADPAAKIAKQR